MFAVCMGRQSKRVIWKFPRARAIVIFTGPNHYRLAVPVILCSRILKQITAYTYSLAVLRLSTVKVYTWKRSPTRQQQGGSIHHVAVHVGVCRGAEPG